MTLHFLLTEEDGDIIFWKESLPPFYFSGCVRDILRAEKRKKYAFLQVPDEQGFIKKRVDTKIYLTGKEEIEIVMSFPKRSRTRTIKKLIRKHLRANYQGAKVKKPVEEIEEDTKEETKIQIQEVIENKEPEKITVTDESTADEMSEEYKKMLSQLSRRNFS